MECNLDFFMQYLPMDIVREIQSFFIPPNYKSRIKFHPSKQYPAIENACTVASIYNTLFHKLIGGYRVISISRTRNTHPTKKPTYKYYINTEFLEFDCECQNERTDICNCIEPTKIRMYRKYVGNDFDYALLCYTTTI